MVKLSELNKSSYKIGEASKILGVSGQTIRNYEKQGTFKFDRTDGGHRVISKDQLIDYLKQKEMLIDDMAESKSDVIYICTDCDGSELFVDQVASILNLYNGNLKNPLIIKEYGNSIEDTRPKLLSLLDDIMDDKVRNLYITSRYNLATYGFHYIERICIKYGVGIYTLEGEN